VRGEPMVAVALLAGMGMALPSVVASQGAAPSRFNYSDHVRPLLEKRCGTCHRRGGAGPMSLLEYEEAVPWSYSMTLQILEGRMPPWLPAEGIGDFENSRGLTATEIDVLASWAVGNMPEGRFLPEDEAAVAPAPAWSAEAPDLVLRPDEPVAISEDADEETHCVVMPTHLTQPRIATAFEVKPGLPTVVQRATVTRGTSCDGNERPLFTWLPDQERITVPGEAGELLPPGSSLAVEILYRRGWDDEGPLMDRTEVGLWFTPEAMAVQSVRVTEAAYVFPGAVEILAIYPDPAPAESAEPFRLEARSAAGDIQPVLVIENYEAAWREKYLLRRPLLLPGGTELRLSRPAVWLDFRIHDPDSEDSAPNFMTPVTPAHDR